MIAEQSGRERCVEILRKAGDCVAFGGNTGALWSVTLFATSNMFYACQYLVDQLIKTQTRGCLAEDSHLCCAVKVPMNEEVPPSGNFALKTIIPTDLEFEGRAILNLDLLQCSTTSDFPVES